MLQREVLEGAPAPFPSRMPPKSTGPLFMTASICGSRFRVMHVGINNGDVWGGCCRSPFDASRGEASRPIRCRQHTRRPRR